MTNSSELFERGEFYVTVVTRKDVEAVPEGHCRAFAIVHRPTGVQCAVTSMLPAAIRVTCMIDSDLKKVRENPDGPPDDDIPMRGFGPAFG